MKIGSVFDQTSTTEFVAMLDPKIDGEKLLFSYVELSPKGGKPNPKGERIIARITNVMKENPLLSKDQAGVSAAIDLGGLGFDFSRRFTYGWAQCTVIGSLYGRGLDMNRRSIAPNAEIHVPSIQTLRQLFFNPSPSYVPLGSIETFGTQDEVPVTLNADQLVTKHFCIFGMTGSGKTNTAAKLIEEMMARGHRMIIFDSHDDYRNLEVFSNLFVKQDGNGQKTELRTPSTHAQLVESAINQLNITSSPNRQINDCTSERLLRTASVVFNNTPARQFLVPENENFASQNIEENFVDAISSLQPWRRLIEHPQVASFQIFPELLFYGPDFEDFTIGLLAAFQGESFSAAQYRCLRNNINQRGSGIDYLRNLYRSVRNDLNARQETRDVLMQMINGIQAIYRDASNAGSEALDLRTFFENVADRENGRPETVFRLSLTDLSSNLRKATVYAVVTYFFRSFKFGGYRARNRGDQPANAFSTLFVLEEARALIPKTSGLNDQDTSGRLARNAMRELAYEGRKFSLGFGVISQKPSSIDQEVVSQSNTFILHQLKSPDDQSYMRTVTESMSQEELEMVKSLGTGRAIVSGVAVQSPVLLNVYFRYSEEGIQEPTPIRDELSSVEQIRKQLNVE